MMQPHIKKRRLSVFWDCIYICRTGSFSGFTSPVILSTLLGWMLLLCLPCFPPGAHLLMLENSVSWRPGQCDQKNSQVVLYQRFVQASGSVYFDLGYCCSLFLVTSSTSLAVWIFLPLSFEFLTPCLRSRMCFTASTLQPVEYRRGSNVFLVADMSSLAYLLWETKKQAQMVLLSAFPLTQAFRYAECIWNIIFQRIWYFYHLWLCLIPIEVIPLDLKCFPLPFVMAAGKAAVLLMDFVGCKFDSSLTAKASSLLRQYHLCI